jgi:atypical dual specificity phosphatase
MSSLRSFTWIDQGLLGAMARPASAEELVWLRDQGVQLLITLTEEPPPRSWVEEAGLLLFHVPIEDMEPPTQEQLDRCVSAIARANAQQMGVVVHCGAGLGRTGTVLAAYLVSKGMSTAEALARIRRLRPGSIETEAQGEAVAEFARRFRSSAGKTEE